jgi:histidine kinase
MLSIKIKDILLEKGQNVIARALDSIHQQQVLLTQLRYDDPDTAAIQRFQQQYEMAQLLEGDGFIKPLSFLEYNKKWVMISEDPGGLTLEQYLEKQGAFSIEGFLNIALQLVQLTERLHQYGIVHQNLHPSQFLLTSDQQVYLMNLESAFRIEEHHQQVPLFQADAYLSHIAPEQTGKVHRTIDARTDFYSLGVTFYRMITRTLPFQAKDALEWMHCHIAVLPLCPHEILPTIPQPISDIIMKCLAKNQQERYQTSYGLKKDLEKCLFMKETGIWKSFSLGQYEFYNQFRLPDALYGRNHPSQHLNELAERTAQGSRECILISGRSGIGKTTFIQKWLQTQRKKDERIHFAQGKFVSSRLYTPYSGIVDALTGWIRSIAEESENELTLLKQQILQAIKGNSWVLTELVPELVAIIGPQPQLQLLPQVETENRLQFTIKQFIQLLCRLKGSLILFLDDFQWADTGSLCFLKNLLEDAGMESLLLIVTYRSNELSADHIQFLDEIRQRCPAITSIELNPLGWQDINLMLSDVTKRSTSEVIPLTRYILDKTQGNPYYIRQILHSLYDSKLLYFNDDNVHWEWSMNHLRSMPIHYESIDYITEQFNRLPLETQSLILTCSCIGNAFSLSLLASIHQEAFERIRSLLKPAVDIGFIRMEDPDKAIFQHDKILEAIYGSISTVQKQALHYQIGASMWARYTSNQHEHVFDITHHLNYGVILIKDKPTRIQLAELNLQAGQKAKASSAYSAAIHYFSCGLEQLGPDGWSLHYPLYFRISVEKSECEYFAGNLTDAEHGFSTALKRAQSTLEKAELYYLLAILYTNKGYHQSALDSGVKGLKLLGIELPSNPGALSITIQLVKIKTILAFNRKHPLDYLQLPPMEDDRLQLAMKLMMGLTSPAYFVNTNTYILLMLKMMGYSLQFGNTKASAYAYNAYGLILGSSSGDYESGYKFGHLGIELCEKLEEKIFSAKTFFFFGVFISPWRKHIKSSLHYFDKAYEYGIEEGDLVFAGYAKTYELLTMDYMGCSLETIFEKSLKYQLFIEQTLNKDTSLMMELIQRMNLSLRGLSSKADILGENEQDEQQFEAALKQQQNQVVLQVFYLKKMQLYCLLGHDQKAQDMAKLSEQCIQASFGLIHVPEHLFYQFVATASAALETKEALSKQLRQHLRKSLAKMQRWTKHCPQNFNPLFTLMKAMLHELNGANWEASAYYDQSIESAKVSGFQHIEAMANERAGQFHIRMKRYQVAKGYLNHACYLYSKWGSDIKALQLRKQYREWLDSEVAITREGLSLHSLHSRNHIELEPILSAAQVISEEIILEQLLTLLMKTMLRTAGAQKGVLLLKDGASWFLEAEAEFKARGHEHIKLLHSLPLEHASQLPSTIIQHVIHNESLIVLDNPHAQQAFANDPYLIQQQSSSICCVPIIKQARLIGIIYMENKWTPGVFLAEPLKGIQLLASQAAISIENAKLYMQLEEKVKERTYELALMEKSRRELVSSISHELRTPITSIQGYLEAILDEVISKPEDQRKYLNIIHSRIIGLNRLIEDLFELSKLKNAQLQFHFSSIHTREWLTRLFDKYQLDVAKGEIRYNSTLQWPESLNPVLSIDIDRIEQVFNNIIFNAIRHTPQGGEIRVMAALTPSQKELSVSISDTGAGIDENILPKVFDRFFTRSASGGSTKGSGLGLAIAKEIIDAHGGHIFASSEKGKGSTFTFLLPIQSLRFTETT